MQFGPGVQDGLGEDDVGAGGEAAIGEADPLVLQRRVDVPP